MTDTTATASSIGPPGAVPQSSPRVMQDLIDPAVLGQFVEPAKLEHYQLRFAGILGAQGLGERPIERVSFAQIASAALSQRPLRLWLPALDDSQYNVPAAIFTIYWAVWRKVAFAWILVALWLAVIIGDVLLKQASGMSLILTAYVPIALGFGVLGNSLLLYQIVREVRAGAIRRDRTSVAGAAAAGVLILGGGVMAVIVEDRDAARNCASKDAQELVISIVRRHYDPQQRFNLLDKIEIDTIRQRQLIGEVQHCAAGLTLTGPNGLILTRSHPITYTLEVTADRRLYATVDNLP